VLADDTREWLEADGLGGFASGTVSGIRTRRYHALLLIATTPPTGRMVLVNGFDAWVEYAGRRIPISSQRYVPGIVHPDGASRIESFTADPWPAWNYQVSSGLRIGQEIVVPHERAAVAVVWRLVESPGDDVPIRVVVRPFLSGRDYHSTHHENSACSTTAITSGDAVTWQPYDSVPPVISRTNADYTHEPDWYRQFLYSAEQARGLDALEDLLAPGWLTFDLRKGQALWLLQSGPSAVDDATPLAEAVSRLRDDEQTRRAAFASPLHRAADAYLVKRGDGRTIIAGYPWFTDWGRDTFFALRGLCLDTARVDEACNVLLTWSAALSDGMLPNRFPDRGERPEFNSVDASLWFVLAVRDLCAVVDRGEGTIGATARSALVDAARQVLDACFRGTRFGIRADSDGLLACGEPGLALTWMDARVDGRPVTPRIGKPVEVQALWLNALQFGASWDSRWQAIATQGRDAFASRFWNASRGCLYDVVDVDHEAGRVDPSVRPNQIFAAGGLGTPLVDPDRARAVVDVVERTLLTPQGLRTLAPGEPGYAGHHVGGPAERDAAYHQGTAWPFLMEPFVEAWLAANGDDEARRREASERFLRPLIAQLEAAGLGHLSELADAEPPFSPGGCPFQAWSMGSLIRLRRRLG